MMSVERQPLHWRWSEVARDESVEAEMTMPGSRTSFVRVSACEGREGEDDDQRSRALGSRMGAG
jgi:hypothetical protein